MPIDFDVGEVIANPPTGKRRMRVNSSGSAELVAPDGSALPMGGAPVGWEAERLAVALDRISTLNRYKGTDLVDGDFVLAGTAQPAAPATIRSAGVLEMPSAAGDGQIHLGKTAQQMIIGAPKAESWYVASRVLIPATFNPAGGVYSIPIGFIQTSGHALYISGTGSVSTTIFQLEMYAPGVNRTALGAVGTLGAATCPIGTFFVVAMYFDASTGFLTVEFNDTVALTTNSLANMSANAASVSAQANDNSKRMMCDGLFWAGVAAAA